jgi:hypothetical protein
MADMTETSLTLDHESKRYPLSFTQEWFISLDRETTAARSAPGS